MKQRYSLLILVIFCLVLKGNLRAQQIFFTDLQESSFERQGNRTIIPNKFRMLEADVTALKNFLWSLPAERNLLNRNLAPEISLPLPNGSIGRFRIWESSIQEPGLEAQFPEIRTFCGQGIDDPYATIRLDFNPYFGFHAQVLTIHGNFFIDPYSRNDIQHYISYYRSDLIRDPGFSCEFDEENYARPGEINAGPCRGTTLKTYRLAVACTGEYAQAVGGAASAAALHAAIVTTVNRVVGVCEKELALRFTLIANNQIIEYRDPATDPFTGNNNAGTLINESQTVIAGNIGTANFDIGHTFSTGGGGLAGLGVVCNAGSKARGITGSPNPVGDAYDIDFVAHEMGHQLGGNHTFNSNTSSCGGNRSSIAAYEVGSATTIMGYAGLCGSDNIQNSSDAVFHAVSFDEISNYINGGGNSCGTVTPTGNNLPVITSLGNSGTNIPLSTPFTLTGAATDADGDALSYCWEEWDLGAATAWNGGNANSTSPLFKSRIPKATGRRTFPDSTVIRANFPTNPTATIGGLKGETLPTLARTMKFRLTVRDNRAAGGGIVSGGAGCQTGLTTNFTVNAITGTGPFRLTYPNGGESFPGGSQVTVTWNVAGTNTAPINTEKVKITLSTDAGLTFPTVLSDSTENDGSADILLPAVVTTTARVKVEAVGNIYFDFSNANFSITQAVSAFNFSSTAPASIPCGGPSSASIDLGTTSTGGFNTPINLTASGNPAGTTVSFSVNPLTPGSNTLVTLNNTNTLSPGVYTVTVTGDAGTVTRTATLSYEITAGTGPVIGSQPAAVQICEGSNASFTASATGATGLQWQVSIDGGTTWNNITDGGVYSGATTGTLTLTAPPSSFNNNIYRLNAFALCGSSTSSNAALTVNSPAAITAQPQNATACENFSQSFSVTATGSGLTYQWQVSSNGCNSFSDILGANSNNYTISSVSASQNNNCYRVVVNGICPGGPLTSNTATLSVASTTSITGQPANASVCSGDDAVFSVNVSGSVSAYQWQISTNGGTSWNNISGATGSTLTIQSTTTALNNNQYRVIINGCTATPITSGSATLFVNTPVNITTQPANASTCSGNTTIQVQATGSGLNYQWQVSTDGGTTWNNVSNVGIYSGTNSATLTITGAGTSASGNIYRVKITGTCNAAGLSSGNASLSVNTPVSISSQPADFSICLSGPATATFSVTATGSGLTYQWQLSTNGGTTWSNISGATGASYTTAALTAGFNGNRYRVVLNGNCTTNLNSTGALLTVTSPVTINTQPAANVNACVDGPATFNVVATGASTYQWQVSTDGGNNYTNISGANNSSYTISPVSSSLNGNRYRVQITGNPCGFITSDAALLSIGSSHSVTIASNGGTQITPSTPILLSSTVSPSGNYSYQWYYNGNAIPNATNATLQVTAGSLGNYEVRAFSSASNCTDTSNTLNITGAPSNDLFIYPNPNTGRFNVSYYSPGSSSVTRTLTVYDAKGARVLVKREAVTGAYYLMKVNLENVSSGVYMIDLRDDSGNRLATGKVVIE